jgi:hypothetical protein
MRDVLNGSLKLGELILLRDLEKLWVISCETQRELEVFPLLILCQTKPTPGTIESITYTTNGSRRGGNCFACGYL